MNILIYIPAMYYCEPNFYLEIIQRHRNLNDNIYILRCNTALKEICNIAEKYPIFQNTDTSCETCQNNFNTLLGIAKIPSDHILFTDYETNEINLFRKTMTYNEIANTKYDKYDIGLAIINTISCGLNIYKPDINKYFNIFKKIAKPSIDLYEKTLYIINKYNIKKVYLFNGRIAINKPIVRACQKLSIHFTCLEYSYRQGYFSEYENSYPQDPSLVQKFYHRLKDINISDGHIFYQHQRYGISQNEFIKNMRETQIPYDFDSQKKNIAIYLSTLVEIAGLSEFDSPLIPESNTAVVVAAIAEKFLPSPQYHFYLRCHPNMITGEGSQQLRDVAILEKINYPNITIIWPNSPINSYALMEHCDKILTFGSTVGIEATYYKKPSILIGVSSYCWTGGVYSAESFQHAISLLQTEGLEPKSQICALKYGAAIMNFGTKFIYHDPQKNTSSRNKLQQILFNAKSYIISKIRKKIITHTEHTLTDLRKKYAELYDKQKITEVKMSIEPIEIINFRHNVEKYIDLNT